MKKSLEQDKEIIGKILEKAFSESVSFLETLKNEENIAPKAEGTRNEDIPEEGMGAEAAIDKFIKKYKGSIIKSAGPRYFGFVVGGATPAALAGDWLTSAFDQNAFGIKGNVDTLIEKEAIGMLKELMGITDEYNGTFVTGATMANFVNLAAGRQWAGYKTGVNVAREGLSKSGGIIAASCSPHSSIGKALSMCGMGRDSLKIVKCIDGREAVDIEAMEEFLQKNMERPVIIIANLGTVNTGDFDDLAKIAALKGKYSFWLHVDAAFAGVAACSEKYRHYFEGINQADTITVDTHKWLNTPYDGAVQFTKHQLLQEEVFSNNAAYLGSSVGEPDIFNLTPENSRRMRALPVWITLMAYGKSGYREIVERNCRIAEEFGRLIEESEYFRLLAEVRLNIVCFTLNSDENELQQELISRFLEEVRKDGKTFMTSTIYKGVPAVRIAVSNWQTEDSDVKEAYWSLVRCAKYLKE
ncbi:MAG: aspartate aminotransferase family protein [Clostridiaceae bacterium]